MTADEARQLIRYTTWATSKIIDAVKALPADVRDRPTGISHESIGVTFAHIYWADRAWLQRLLSPEKPLPPKSTFDEALADWPNTLAGWHEWADSLDDAAMSRVVHYKSMIFGQGATPVDQIVMHVVNHATLHRGQIMGMLRQAGIAPPPTDMIFFFREQAAAAQSAS